MENKKDKSLALGGGSAWGFAHIGLLKSFDENKIELNEIAGCSMGAIITGLYAALDFDACKLWDLFHNMSKSDFIKLFDPSFKTRPLFKGEKLKKFLESFFKRRKIGDFEKDIKIIASTKEHKHRLVVFDKNTLLIDAVMASCSLPPMFPDYNGLVDGGFNTIVPVNVLKKQNYKIASNVYCDVDYSKLSDWYKKNYYFSVLKQYQKTRKECEKADIVIEYNMKPILIMDFFKYQKIIEIGYKKINSILIQKNF
ncbi:MAG: patatin-like phospholipase family protein [Candidatus Muirbacterium halophilum]|nr:patatin-like phospholipase family protein [Candidatus Muirbacterium halophilum]MCK9474974.1 patatin-like phospholipase family protein [Candidatus Muirbacterium halophilum]